MQDTNSEPEALLPPLDTPGQASGTGAQGRQLETGPLSHQYSYHREETADPSVVTVARTVPAVRASGSPSDAQEGGDALVPKVLGHQQRRV